LIPSDIVNHLIYGKKFIGNSIFILTHSNYKYNNNWFIVDVTFDDPIVNGISPESGDISNIRYDYLMTYKIDKKHNINYSKFNITINKVNHDCHFIKKDEISDYQNYNITKTID